MMFNSKTQREYKPVLDEDEESNPSSEAAADLLLGLNKKQTKYHRYHKLLVFVVALMIVTIYSVGVAKVTQGFLQSGQARGAGFLRPPADDYIAYEMRVLPTWEPEEKPYFTDPSPEVDRNWHEMFEYHNLGISPERMKDMGRIDQGIELPDGRYYGTIMAFHHLHCLKSVYRALHPEYYGLDELPPEWEIKQSEHIGHCLHYFREWIMCHADLTLMTMKWTNKHPYPMGNFSAPHQCVDWNKLMEWAKLNSEDVTADGVLVHPKWGPVITDGQFIQIEGLTVDLKADS